MKVSIKLTVAALLASSLLALPAFAKTHHHKHRKPHSKQVQSYNGFNRVRNNNNYDNTNNGYTNSGYNNGPANNGQNNGHHHQH